MHWTQDDSHPFAGIAKKLERADENIVNLHTEILRFFQECEHPVIPNPKDKNWQKAVDYHSSLVIPKRFGVLSGEILHHLRSCLDHFVWHFSSLQSRIDYENSIEFPVYREPPTEKQRPRYDRKIQGIANPNVRKLIDDLQPYQRRPHAINDPVCIIHDMDRFDKHRELVIVRTSAQIQFRAGTSVEIVQNALAYTQGKAISREALAAIGAEIKKDHQVTPDVAFAQFGEWKTQPLIPCLMQLLDAMDKIGDRFALEV